MKLHLATLCLLAVPVAGVKLRSRDLVHSDRMNNEPELDNLRPHEGPEPEPNLDDLSPQCVETTGSMTEFNVKWNRTVIYTSYLDNNNKNYMLDRDGFDTYLKICDFLGGQTMGMNTTHSVNCVQGWYLPPNNTYVLSCLGSMCDESDIAIYASDYENNDFGEDCQISAHTKFVGGKVSSSGPSALPSMLPSSAPSATPSSKPSDDPSASPSSIPSSVPSTRQSLVPSGNPSTGGKSPKGNKGSKSKKSPKGNK